MAADDGVGPSSSGSKPDVITVIRIRFRYYRVEPDSCLAPRPGDEPSQCHSNVGYWPGQVIELKTRPGDTKEPTRETRTNPVGGASDGLRSRYILLGRQMFYRLNYTRICALAA